MDAIASSDATAEELGREYLRALCAHDKPGIMAVLADDFALEVPSNLSGSNDLSDSWHGLAAAGANFDTAFRIIAVTAFAELEFTSAKDPDIAFAEGLGAMTMANGQPYNNRYVFRFDSRDGKLIRVREYVNPITSAIAFGLPLPVSTIDGVDNKFV